MKLSGFKYLTGQGMRNVWVNRLMSMASVFVLTSCMILMGLAFLVTMNIGQILTKVEDMNVVKVFLTDNATQSQIDDVGRRIEELPNVKPPALFVSREEGYQKLLSSMTPAEQKAMQGLDSSVLPDSYTVTLKDLTQYDDTISKLSSIANVDSVNSYKSISEQLVHMRSSITNVSLWIIGLLLLVSLFIIANTIKLTMYSRRLEINIMKSVGATNGFIRFPFIVEGAVIGLFAGLLSLGIVFAVYQTAFVSFIQSLPLGTKPTPFLSSLPYLIAGYFIIGVAVGVIGSMMSIRKYLKYEGSEFNEI